MTTSMTNATRAGQELKAKHRAMWALGDYPALVGDIVADLAPTNRQAEAVGPRFP